ncbi:MAG: tRNA lysidine(34) synthetase TilS [Candidatus Marinimicrobia bacterium]|nr:tRNA lysidine(34) synthetase TilS [Candidatus Neomarinimicrobiota bacterium]
MLSRATFEETLSTSSWYHPGQKILCACSGGIDSTVLLHLLQKIPDIHGDIVHFDHQLRGVDSQSDLSFVQELGKRYGCKVHVISENIREYANQHKLSIEEAGSLRRRASFRRVNQEQGYDWIALGQHEDDQIETILMNLYLGTGIKGLAGVAEHQDHFVRPLMQYSRAEIEAYAQQEGLSYCIDKSNADINILRNNIRVKLIPFMDDPIDPRWRTLFTEISQLGSVLHEKTARSAVVVDNIDIRRGNAQNISLGLGKLTDYFSPIQKVIFDSAFQAISSMSQGLSAQHFKALRSLLPKHAIARETHLPGSVIAIRNRNSIAFIKRHALEWNSMDMTDLFHDVFPFFEWETLALSIHTHVQDPDHFWYSSDPEHYRLRMHVKGDKMKIHPSDKWITIKQILQEAHVAPALKSVYPVLEHRGVIVWVPGIRTAVSGLVDLSDCIENEVRHCFRVKFQEGTFE